MVTMSEFTFTKLKRALKHMKNQEAVKHFENLVDKDPRVSAEVKKQLRPFIRERERQVYEPEIKVWREPKRELPKRKLTKEEILRNLRY